MTGLFGGLFDFNHDGEMDSFERAAEFEFLEELEREERFEDGDDYTDDEF